MESLVELARMLKDPALVISLVVIFGLFYLLNQKEKTNKELASNIGECNETMAGLYELVKVIVYGKRGGDK